MRSLGLLSLLLFVPSGYGAEVDSGFRFAPDRSIAPQVDRIVATRAGSPGPGEPKYTALAQRIDPKAALAVEPGLAVDLWLIPKVGVALRIASARKAEVGKMEEIRLTDTFGILTVRGDNLPRLGRIVVTAADDPGPDEKGHRPIQFADEYKADAIVPAGTYRIWIVPHNGARATKLDDTVRAFAGRTVAVD